MKCLILVAAMMAAFSVLGRGAVAAPEATSPASAPAESVILRDLRIGGWTTAEDGFFYAQSNLEELLAAGEGKGRPTVLKWEDPVPKGVSSRQSVVYFLSSGALERHFGTWPVPVIDFLNYGPIYNTVTMQEHAAWNVDARALSDETLAERASWCGATHLLRCTVVASGDDASFVLRMIEAPGGKLLAQETIPLTATGLVEQYPPAQRRLLRAAGARIPKEHSETYGEGIFGSAESLQKLVEATHLDTVPDADIMAARETAMADSPDAPYHFVQALRMMPQHRGMTAAEFISALNDPKRPQSSGGYLRLGDQYTQQPEFAEASYRLAYENRDGLIRAGVAYPMFLLKQKRVREAIPLMEAAAREIPVRAYRLRLLAEFYKAADVAVQDGQMPVDLPYADQLLLGQLKTASLAAWSLATEAAPLDAAANQEYFEALLRGGFATPTQALPVITRAIDRAPDKDFAARALGTACNYSNVNWGGEPAAVAPLLWKMRPILSDQGAESLFNYYLSFHVTTDFNATPEQYLYAQEALPGVALLVLRYGDGALAHRPNNPEHRLMVLAALATVGGRVSDMPQPLAIPEAMEASKFGTKRPLLRLLHAEILDRSGDAAGAARELGLAQEEGIEPAAKRRLSLALAMQKARAGDLGEMLKLVPDPIDADPISLNRRVAALLLGTEEQRKQALEDAKTGIARSQHPLVVDALYSAMMANGDAAGVVADIRQRHAGAEALPPPARHFWREAATATGAGAWDPGKK